MILTDVNVLVYAFRREAARHQVYADWLTAIASGADELALHPTPLAGFLRIVTSARIFERPSPATLALDFVHRLVTAPRSRWLGAPDTTWARFDAVVRNDSAISGNLLPDAWLASLALAHGCRPATVDRGFARYPGLAWFDPAILVRALGLRVAHRHRRRGLHGAPPCRIAHRLDVLLQTGARSGNGDQADRCLIRHRGWEHPAAPASG